MSVSLHSDDAILKSVCRSQQRTLASVNSTPSRLRSSSKSRLSYERGFGVRPQTRITAQFSLTMSISRHSASTEELASGVQIPLGGCLASFKLSLLVSWRSDWLMSRSCVCVCVSVCVCVCVCARACMRAHSLSCLFVTPWTVAHLTPLSMGFSRREHWSGLPFPSP